MNTQTLVLTREYSPHKIVSLERAIMMIFQGKITVVEEYAEELATIEHARKRDFPNVVRAYGQRFTAEDALILRAPAVVSLRSTVGSIKRGVKFSRINVFTRDGFRCQYCGESKRMSALNYDHVVPRHLGGKTAWENIVASCYPCNGRKANRTPEQAGMRLRKQPYKPKTLPVIGPRFDSKAVSPIWIPYLSGFVDLEIEDIAVA